MNPPNTSKLAVVIPVGPNPAEPARLADLLESLARYGEGAIAQVYVVNDGNDPDAIVAAGRACGIAPTVVANPRAGIGDGWLGRLTVGLVCAYRLIRSEHPESHVLKLDTDALIIRPFATVLLREFADAPGVGLIGSTGLALPGVVSGNWWHHRIFKMQRPLTRLPDFPWFRQNLFGYNARLRAHIRRATARGYRFGESVCGGALALRAEAMAALLDLPDMRDHDFLLRTNLGEDVFLSVLVHECGYTLKVHRLPGELFGVAWQGLPAHDVEGVWARGNAIIHSVKSHGPFTEETTRAFFRATRTAPDR